MLITGPELIKEGQVSIGLCLRRLYLHLNLHLLLAVDVRFFFFNQEKGRPRAGGNLPAGSPQVIRVRRLEPPRHSHQETDRGMSEAAGQN